MTGFGRASFRVGAASFEVEVRTGNHRHLDLRVRLPHALAALEGAVRERVGRRLARGKVELGVASPDGGAPPPALAIDLEAARAYLRAARELRQGEGVQGELGVGVLLGLPGVARFAEPELPEEDLRRELLAAVDAALSGADAMRAAEGAALERELQARLARVAELAAGLAERAGAVQAAARERLQKRAEQLARETGLRDEARLAQEIALAADRLDVMEEIVRLRSHVEQFREGLARGGPGQPVGRRLDFLLQELGREVNTIGSKGSDAPLATLVVDLKTELERIREQVQNVE
jgi:uncharacterized protein (TIGR00255 family)